MLKIIILIVIIFNSRVVGHRFSSSLPFPEFVASQQMVFCGIAHLLISGIRISWLISTAVCLSRLVPGLQPSLSASFRCFAPISSALEFFHLKKLIPVYQPSFLLSGRNPSDCLYVPKLKFRYLKLPVAQLFLAGLTSYF